MSSDDPRSEILQLARQALGELAAEGLEFLSLRGIGGSSRAIGGQSPPARTARDSVRASGSSEVADEGDAAEELRAIREDLGECARCPLHETRNSIVFGEGNPDAPVVFVGEGPGAEEDRTGRPFVGRAGELLTKIIQSVGWEREDVYICNIVKCRPPGNRDPEPEEVSTCRPFLHRQLLAIQPRVIVTLGRPAASTLLGRSISITKARGTWQEWNGIPLMPTFHPAYVLRRYTRETRQAVWDDLRAVRARVEES